MIKRDNKLFSQFSILMVLSTLSLFPHLLYGHGITYKQIKTAIVVQVNYKDGSPLKASHVTLFSPNNKEPWLKTTTNEQGEFFFVPDKPGNWKAMVSDAHGHGTRIGLTIDKDLSLTNDNNEMSLFQKVIITLATIWGFVGTALFFKRKKA